MFRVILMPIFGLDLVLLFRTYLALVLPTHIRIIRYNKGFIADVIINGLLAVNIINGLITCVIIIVRSISFDLILQVNDSLVQLLRCYSQLCVFFLQ
jgi:hypothetical protein